MKTYEVNVHDNYEKPSVNPKIAKIQARIAEKKAKRARAHQVVSATGHYAADLTRTGLQGE